MKRTLILALSVIGMTMGHQHHHHGKHAITTEEEVTVKRHSDYPKVAACTLGSVIAGGTQCETSVAAGLTKQIADELTAMGISFARISSARIACGGGCSGFIQ